MNKIFPWTLAALVTGLVLIGSLALAQWEPRERKKRQLVTPPAIPLEVFDKWQEEQVLCYLVKRWRKEWTVQEYSVEPYYPQDYWRWEPVPREDSDDR